MKCGRAARVVFLEARVRQRDPKARLSTFQFFVIGAIAKTCATVITYPYIMAKVRALPTGTREVAATAWG